MCFGTVPSSIEDEAMRRREIITLLGTAAVWLFAAQAQQGQKPVTARALHAGCCG